MPNSFPSHSQARRVAHQQGQPQPVFLTPRQRAEQVVNEQQRHLCYLRDHNTEPTVYDHESLVRLVEVALHTAVTEALDEWGRHDRKCILSQWREGRPTTDGGYETRYGYGDKATWYRETPPCTCGLDAAQRRG